MKIRYSILPLLAALFAAGCQKEPASKSSTSSTSSAPPSSSAPAAKAPAAARVIEITSNDQMKFSVTRIDAKVGEEIKVVLTNGGQLPKEAMGHNFVLLKPGTDINAFSVAAMTAREKDYIPDSMKDQIIAHTKLLGPRQSDEVTFKVTAAGEYPFVCSFPAHAMAGMKGVLVVQ
ncbi:MAG: azurin [Opitutaceae bacterium]|nr:azurin [Opitutaceae bacterium]